ncbi:MAG: class D sortase [Acidobacteriales bacterium]|nr:class D sortase [Terriglobales bacterium]
MDFSSQITRLRSQVSRLLTGRWLSISLMVIGALLLTYVGTQYFAMYSEQRKLTEQWQQQNSGSGSERSAQSSAAVDDGLTRISIPRIDLDAVVVEGTSGRQLAVAPGHLEDTATPGEEGNAVITAHRDTFFRNIYELKKGDNIVIQRRGEVYKFEVTGKKIVAPDDVSALRNSNDARLTLITCYPPYYVGPAPERLVVFSKLVERSPQAQTASTGTP